VSTRHLARSRSDSELQQTVRGEGCILCPEPCGWQPLLELYFLPTKNHPWTWAIPLDGGNLDIVLARNESRALRITRDGVEGLAGRIGNYGIENIRSTVGDLELGGWTLVAVHGIDQSRGR